LRFHPRFDRRPVAATADQPGELSGAVAERIKRETGLPTIAVA